MVKKKKKLEEVVEKELTHEEVINDLLDSCKNRFSEVLIVGLTSDNSLDVVTSAPRYDTMQYILGRAEYELHAHEMNTILTARREKETRTTQEEENVSE